MWPRVAVSSTINPPAGHEAGRPGDDTGPPPVSVRVMAMEAKSRCRMLATTAPGITPARALPIPTSGSYPGDLERHARHISPKNGQSLEAACGACGGARGAGPRPGGAGQAWGVKLTLHTREAQAISAHGFLAPPLRRLGRRRDNTPAPRLFDEALALERQGDYDSALTRIAWPLRDHPTTRHSPEHGDPVHQDAAHRRSDPALRARSSSTASSRARTTDSRSCCSSAATRTVRPSTCARSWRTRQGARRAERIEHATRRCATSRLGTHPSARRRRLIGRGKGGRAGASCAHGAGGVHSSARAT